MELSCEKKPWARPWSEGSEVKPVFLDPTGFSVAPRRAFTAQSPTCLVKRKLEFTLVLGAR